MLTSCKLRQTFVTSVKAARSSQEKLQDSCTMARRSTVLVLILTISCLGSSEPLFRSPCELLPVGLGHPVQAMQKSFAALSGCASKGTISLPQEVHIVILRGQAEGARDTLPEVELHLKPIQALLHHQKPLVFVLNSPQPLMWKIKTENLTPGIRHTFHVSEGSEVKFQPGNFSLACQILNENLPHGNEHLLNWAQRKYSAVTSFSELKTTQDIYIKVGEDPVFSDTCKIDTKFLSLNYLGSYVEAQPSKGCVLSGPDKDREVHIIELQAPNSSSAFQVEVIVDLRPMEDDVLHRDVVLVLKCAKSVNWVIKTHSVRGNLVIVASDTISVSSNPEGLVQVVKFPRQRLPSGSQALIKWAEEHGYKPITSYTNTPVANHFSIQLREPDVVDPVESMFPPELFTLQRTSSHPGEGALPNLPFPFPPPEGFLPSPDNHPPEDHQNVHIAHVVQCEDTKMVVSIEKETLKANGFTNANLVLQDPACKASVNSTHYVLETPLTGCQTTVYPIWGSPMALHINSVLISNAETKDEDAGPQGFVNIKDLMFPRDLSELEGTMTESAQHQSVITFNCTYRKKLEMPTTVPSVLPGPRTHPIKNASFNMELYDTLPFNHSSRQAFYTVKKNQPVFVEVTSTASHPDLSFTITSCFISPNTNPAVASDYTLIAMVCPKDDSVKFYPQRDAPSHTHVERKSFAFTFNSKYNLPLLFLHCEMSLCSRRPHANSKLPPCLQSNEPCDTFTLDQIVMMMTHTKTSSKALVVLDAPPGQPKSPEPVLDTPTVVGIAFAAFVIGALLTGALWFIYSHTAGETETAGTQEIEKPPPASENSSAAHSTGSTQSTPCSSSSTA